MSGLTCSSRASSRHTEGHHSARGPLEGRGGALVPGGRLGQWSMACTQPLSTRSRNCGESVLWLERHLLLPVILEHHGRTRLLSQQDQARVHVSAGHQLDAGQVFEEGVLALEPWTDMVSSDPGRLTRLTGLPPTLLSNRLRGRSFRLKVIAACSREASRQWCCTSG